MKTKEEILNECSADTTTKGRVKWVDAEKAMQEYADQQLAGYKSALNIALRYMEVFMIRGEEPLVGENLKNDLYTVRKLIEKP